MSFIAEMTALAAEFVDSDMFAEATLTRITPGTFDPVAGSVASQTSAAIPCRAVAQEVTTKALDGALVSHTVLFVSVEPKQGDKLAIGATSYVLGDITAEAPHGTALIWTAVAKR